MSAKPKKSTWVLMAQRVPLVGFAAVAVGGLLFGALGSVVAQALVLAGVACAIRTREKEHQNYDYLANVPPPDGWADDLTELTNRLGVERDVRIVSVHPDNIAVLATMSGSTFPVVAFQSDFGSQLPRAQRRAVIAHELGHLVNHDAWIRPLAAVILGGIGGACFVLALRHSLWWLIVLPAVALGVLAMHRGREFRADAVALDVTGDADKLGDAIWEGMWFEERRRGRTLTPRPKSPQSRWGADDLLSRHPTPVRREAAVRRRAAR